MFKVYKYATYILEEASKPKAWQKKTLRHTLYYIHDHALGVLWDSQHSLLNTLFLRASINNIDIPEGNNHYPDDFKRNTFEQEYPSFQLILNDEPKVSILRVLTICLDIYFMSGYILHNIANKKRISVFDLIEFKNICLLLKDAEVHNVFYSRKLTCRKKNSASSKKSNKLSSTKDDYIDMFLDVLGEVSIYPQFTDILSILSSKFTFEHPFKGKIISVYFDNKSCFSKKLTHKDTQYRLLADRTLQNYYTEAKKIHKRLFCEK